MKAIAALACASLVMATSCEFAVKHPAVTSGIVGGTLGMATCEMATESRHGTCAIVAGAAGVGLALVVLAAVLLGGEGHTILVEDQAQPIPDDGQPRHHKPKVLPPSETPPEEPAPPPVDAGVAPEPAPDAAPPP